MLNYDSLRKNDSNKCDGKYSHPRTDPIQVLAYFLVINAFVLLFSISNTTVSHRIVFSFFTKLVIIESYNHVIKITFSSYSGMRKGQTNYQNSSWLGRMNGVGPWN